MDLASIAFVVLSFCGFMMLAFATRGKKRHHHAVDDLTTSVKSNRTDPYGFASSRNNSFWPSVRIVIPEPEKDAPVTSRF